MELYRKHVQRKNKRDKAIKTIVQNKKKDIKAITKSK